MVAMEEMAMVTGLTRDVKRLQVRKGDRGRIRVLIRDQTVVAGREEDCEASAPDATATLGDPADGNFERESRAVIGARSGRISWIS